MGASSRKDLICPVGLFGIAFSSVAAGNTISINGVSYTGVAGVKSDNTEFSVDTDDATALADLLDSITNDTRPEVTSINFTNAGGISNGVLQTAIFQGVAPFNRSFNPHDYPLTTNSPSTILLNRLAVLVEDAKTPSNRSMAMKAINFMNTPFSIQQTGADKTNRLVTVVTEDNFNNIAVGSRVLAGNREGVVKAVVADTSITLTFKNLETGAYDDTVVSIEDFMGYSILQDDTVGSNQYQVVN